MGVAAPGWARARAATRSPSGGGSGLNQLSVVTSLDKSTPALMLATSAGTNLGSIALAVTKTLGDGSEGEYLDDTFQNAVASSVQWLEGGGDRPEVQTTSHLHRADAHLPPGGPQWNPDQPHRGLLLCVHQLAC